MAYYLLFIVALVGLDQFVKYWVSANIALGTSHGFIPGLMNLTNLHNDGAAWSILEGQQWFFYLITLAAVVVLAYLMRQWRTNRWKMIALSLIMAGRWGTSSIGSTSITWSTCLNYYRSTFRSLTSPIRA
ncbi:MAG: hypothetical protein ACFWUH_08065 [Limosilactobacillus fermentum]